LVQSVTHQADEVEDTDDVALRTAAVGEIMWVTSFGITALGAGAMDVNKMIADRTGWGKFRRRSAEVGPARWRTIPSGSVWAGALS
jgi:hypothetical protein